MPTVGFRHPRVTSAGVAMLVAAALIASACGSSSQTESVAAPSPLKCAPQGAAEGSPFPAAGGSGSIRITANRDCPWTATADAAWVTIAAPTQGQGDGSVRISVGANGDPGSRTATISLNDQRVEISQAGKPCELTVSSNHESADAAGGNLSVNVRASADSCTWTATSNVSWISIVSGRDGHGNGAVTFHVDPVSGPPRSANLTIAGQNVQVDQGTGCSVTIATDSFTIDALGGERQVGVTAPAGCSWTAQSQSPWITISGGATGSGPGVVVFRVAASDGAGRTGTVTVAGRNIMVTQQAGSAPPPAPCSYSIAPPSLNVVAQASSNPIQVATGGGCAWSATSAVAWITVASGANGNGPGQVQIGVAANDGPARTGTITIAGRSLTVAQASGCTFTVAPASQNVAGGGGNVVATVTTGAGCSWSGSSPVDWISVGSPDVAGPGQLTLTVKPNASPPRTAGVTIAGRTVTINQASLCKWAFAPSSHDLPASGGNGNVLVFVTGACTWSAVPDVQWIRITAGESGTGPGLLQFVVAPNTGSSRTGTIAIGGENYVVHQSGAGDH